MFADNYVIIFDNRSAAAIIDAIIIAGKAKKQELASQKTAFLCDLCAQQHIMLHCISSSSSTEHITKRRRRRKSSNYKIFIHLHARSFEDGDEKLASAHFGIECLLAQKESKMNVPEEICKSAFVSF